MNSQGFCWRISKRGRAPIEAQVRGRKVNLKELIDQYGVDVESPVRIPELELGDFRAYRVRADIGADIYLLDSKQARELAAWPHVVGSELDARCSECAFQAAAIMSRLGLLEGQACVLHVLRAGLGYRLREAISKAGVETRDLYVRPEYVVTSVRDHRGESVKDVRVTFADFSNAPRGTKVTLFKPDTEATGRTGLVSLMRALDELERKGTKVEKLVLYGFITRVAAGRIAEEALSKGVKEVTVIALVDLADLASNDYDMVLYGPDLHAWATQREFKPLGATVGLETFADILPHYVPGLDQPGDFSERQSKLFNGIGWEEGNIAGHLRSAIEAIETLLTIPNIEDWQREIAVDELEKLRETLKSVTGETV